MPQIHEGIYTLSACEVALHSIASLAGGQVALEKSGLDLLSSPKALENELKIQEVIINHSGKPAHLIQRAFGIRTITLRDMFELSTTELTGIVTNIEDMGGIPLV